MQVAAAPDVLVGTVLDNRYRIERVLGTGGMGTVYEASQSRLGRRVAIKTIHGHLAGSPVVVERFEREAMAAASIGSPHIVEVYDLGTLPGGAPYMVMELLGGQDLGSIVEQHGPLRPKAAAHLISQACEALGAAHEIGIVHRDVKPENIMVVPTRKDDQFVKVVDFGISKLRDSSLTGSGELLGTPYTMAPEQLTGAGNVDARADVFGLGVTLYYALCGQMPYDAESLPLLIAKISTGEIVPLRQRRGDFPPVLYDIVATAMAHDRERRFRTTDALSKALESLQVRPKHSPDDLAFAATAFGQEASLRSSGGVQEMAAMAAPMFSEGPVPTLHTLIEDPAVPPPVPSPRHVPPPPPRPGPPSSTGAPPPSPRVPVATVATAPMAMVVDEPPTLPITAGSRVARGLVGLSLVIGLAGLVYWQWGGKLGLTELVESARRAIVGHAPNDDSSLDADGREPSMGSRAEAAAAQVVPSAMPQPMPSAAPHLPDVPRKASGSGDSVQLPDTPPVGEPSGRDDRRPETPDVAALSAQFRRLNPMLRVCATGYAGTVTMDVVFQSDGAVRHVLLTSQPPLHEQGGDCIRAFVRRILRSNPFRRETATVRRRLRFDLDEAGRREDEDL